MFPAEFPVLITDIVVAVVPTAPLWLAKVTLESEDVSVIVSPEPNKVPPVASDRHIFTTEPYSPLPLAPPEVTWVNATDDAVLS